jgi:hypothetical protein
MATRCAAAPWPQSGPGVPALQFLPARIQLRTILRKLARQAKQFKIVRLQIHGDKKPPARLRWRFEEWAARLQAVHSASDAEALATAAAVTLVGVVELEAFVQAFAHEIQLGAVDVGQALGSISTLTPWLSNTTSSGAARPHTPACRPGRSSPWS